MSRALLAGWLAALLAPAAGAGDEPALKLSGYYKNLLAKSQTVAPADQAYTLDLNRLRLEIEGRLGPAVAFDIQYDNELLLGSYLNTAEFGLRKDQRPDQYWRLESNYSESGGHYGRHRLYRAFITLAGEAADVRLGRQRIAWGTGRFWSPLDLFNPINPAQLEREERPGVDAALVERKLGPLSKLAAAYAPRHERGEASAAALWQGNARGLDFSFAAGRFRREDVAGLALAGQIGGAGVRAEWTRNRPQGAGAFRRALLALDYAFRNTLTLSGEWYHNGAGTGERARYDFASLAAGRIQNVGRRYLGLYAGYEITPLLKWTNYLVANLDDGSRYFSPTLGYSLCDDLEWTVGVQHFRGSAGSEYARFRDVYFTALQWYF